ncbi:thyroid hormone receptor interactor 10b isoform X1 [Conger conger]|uniref:thyroid hormone receptor interactor 10b isoform X1 n=1 Tax=Conger conger TaxID=82655 RepID=UPI002A5A9E02|nr:thyroid hormone receptor interactor 10b isoform X1 [Conger conger]
MGWGTDLWDQYDVLDKHTQSGLDLVDRYVKFVKERTEIEQNYAKQLRNLSKKYTPKRGSKEEQECRFTNQQAFVDILNEMNDYAGQREIIAENMMLSICLELTKYLQEVKQERKSCLSDAKKAQQTLESSYKQLDNIKKRFEREWREAEKANQNAEKVDQDSTATKADVEKAKVHAHSRTHTAEESRNDYAALLQKYNKEQNQFYFTEIPQIYSKLQEVEERRVRKLAEGYTLFAEMEKRVMPIIGKCLEGIAKAGNNSNTNAERDSMLLVEQHKSGFERPGDLEFEDYSHGMNRASSESSLGTPKGPLDLLGKNKKLWPFSKKKLPPPPLTPDPSPANGLPGPKFSRDPLSYCLKEINRTVKPRISSFRTLRRTPAASEDFGHLPPEQRRKKLQQKMDDIGKELQKEVDQSQALEKMKDVYEKNSQLGDPSSLEPQISQTALNVQRLQGEMQKYESWLIDAGGQALSRHGSTNNNTHDKSGSESSHENNPQAIYTEFDDDFDDEEEIFAPIGQCTALYNFEGSSEGTIPMRTGEVFAVVEEDKGDGWTRVQSASGDEGYIPTSYVKISPGM